MGNRYVAPRVRANSVSTAPGHAAINAPRSPIPAAPPAGVQVRPTLLHPRNRHQGRYDLARLVRAFPGLKRHLTSTPTGESTIDFAHPPAVEALNAALLADWFGIAGWKIPPGFLCPPIPGRADYLHHVADLLASMHAGQPPRGPQIRVLDIGVGANVVYPLIGHGEYGWSFVGSDSEPAAVASARQILAANPKMASAISIRHQLDPAKAFTGIVTGQEAFDLTICNPPFHATVAEAHAETKRKWRNLDKDEVPEPVRNFGGQAAELYCAGGELGFISRMISDSIAIGTRCAWFTTLVAHGRHLPKLGRVLHNARVQTSRIIEMGQGDKRSRLVAWTFHEPRALRDWAQRWL